MNLLALAPLFTLVSALFLHAKYNGIMDHIMFYRTHIGQHPYRDYWHLCKHISRANLVLVGISIGLMLSMIKLWALLSIIFIPGFYIVFSHYAFTKPNDKYYLIDEEMKISTKWLWLDKKLGFHH